MIREIRMTHEVTVKNRVCSHPDCSNETDCEISAANHYLFPSTDYTLVAHMFIENGIGVAGMEVTIPGSYDHHDGQSLKGFFCSSCYTTKVMPALMALGMTLEDSGW